MQHRTIVRMAMLGASLALCGAAHAATVHTILVEDLGDTHAFVIDAGTPITCISVPNGCIAIFAPSQTPGTITLTSTLPQLYNIYDDPGMTEISDTLAVSAYTDTQGYVGFKEVFLSDLNGAPPTALASAQPIVETGAIQSVTSVMFSNGVTDILQFESDAPEPGFGWLAALLGCGMVALRKRN